MVKHSIRALAMAAAVAVGFAPAAGAQAITVGGKNFTEQLLLSDMTGQYLDAHGFDADVRNGMGSTVLRRAQLNGQVDLYWEYVGTSLITYNKVEGGAKMSRQEAYEKVKKLDAEKGLVWLKPSQANNTYAIAMEEEDAEKRGVETISDLAKLVEGGKELTFATDAEFASRPDGLPGLQEHYGFSFPRAQVKRMDAGLVYKALNEDEVNSAMVFATDGRNAAFDFRVLEDDQNFFPNYAITPVVREDVLKKHPKLRELMNELSSKLDDATMQRLNKQVDVEKKSVSQVAETFLKENGLI
ncbi:osmoprotectant transport system substrate-binding protein [Limimonas halophila]|uniref:Osmoprotectant transport system substrate-binding protein n=1 Tax=Limimonas halophila TaxID=1082479 RepID=A0A1G7SQW8_9PROT|nr:glycine betaine ABC transporter substrate-binding protein [Limimonas halophila]SDG25433.1 osmoprotectant transport system substrate-binding protein [Limimonas halophila]